MPVIRFNPTATVLKWDGTNLEEFRHHLTSAEVENNNGTLDIKLKGLRFVVTNGDYICLFMGQMTVMDAGQVHHAMGTGGF